MTAAEQRLADLRRRYAEEIAYRAHVTSPRLQRAFAAVPRERFLEPGPWRLKSDLVDDYWTTPDADPAHLYHDVVVALDEGRGLDNGLPSLRALLFEAAAIDAGERVVHIGCGAGYYSAILAETVGPRGGVVAVEADAGLAARAEAGLGDRDNVLVVHGDGFAYDPGAADVIIVNAGVTRPAPAWLDALRPGGRLLLTLTTEDRSGLVFRITRQHGGYAATPLIATELYPCEGGRDVDSGARLAVAMWQRNHALVRSLRRDAHPQDDDCWLHGGGFCLSGRAPGKAGG